MKLTIDHIHVKPDPKIEEYIEEKIGKLDHVLSRHAKDSAHADVKLKAGPGRGQKKYICEVVVHLPQQIITVNQAGITSEAAIDLAEAKLRIQLKKYKDKHVLNQRHKPVR